jgi:hypothetical protein
VSTSIWVFITCCRKVVSINLDFSSRGLPIEILLSVQKHIFVDFTPLPSLGQILPAYRYSYTRINGKRKKLRATLQIFSLKKSPSSNSLKGFVERFDANKKRPCHLLFDGCSIEEKTVDDCGRLNPWIGNRKMIKKRQMTGGVIWCGTVLLVLLF